ncbi:MAG: beta-lactamase family protein [Ruminococcaceae bacterium]|nr:beta-lactamase family protein [Oscillospiraceae bacterium]
MNFKNLDQFIKQLPELGVPACELAVTYEGNTVYHETVGYANVAEQRPASKNDLRWLFSCTKVMTCIAAMRLVEEGKLSISDPVSRYLPEYAHLKVKNKETGEVTEARETMTVAHLFGMMGGMDYDLKAPAVLAAVAKGGSTREIVAAMAEKPLHFEPGTSFLYSLCHDVLAAVVEVASGMTFGEYLDKIIFKPLGLTDIGFFPTAEQEKRFAEMYKYDNIKRELTLYSGKNEYCLAPGYESGGAGLFSTVTAYSKFLATLANGKSPEGYVLLKPETIRMISETDLMTPGGRDGLHNSWPSRFFGYSWGLCGRVHLDPISSLSLAPKGEFGWDGAACSYCLIDPQNRLSVMLGLNVRQYTYGYHMLHPHIRNLVYGAVKA